MFADRFFIKYIAEPLIIPERIAIQLNVMESQFFSLSSFIVFLVSCDDDEKAYLIQLRYFFVRVPLSFRYVV